MNRCSTSIIVMLMLLCVHASATDDSINELLKQALQGDLSSQYTLGYLYHSGDNVHRDINLAISWYQKAALAGHQKAAHILGTIYDFGREVQEDNPRAVKWYRAAAAQGDPEAQTSLGKMYYNGEGLNQSDTKAFAWWSVASAQGFEPAKRLIRDIGVIISQRYIDEATEAAEACRLANYENCKF
ncbi:MAG: tetratricopeptide repeat protein [Porticoccaceae bacterium]|nr:tetratricopeptide repeat protein [Porticoccaceae bacterium]